jgi:hypothetical protein
MSDLSKVSRALRRGRFGAALVAVAIVSLLLPSALGAAPAAKVVTKAPFTGYPVSSIAVNTNGCGATTLVAKFPIFNLSNGRAQAAGHTSVVGCGASPFAPVASIILRAGLDGANFTVAGGKHVVWVNWSFAWTVNLTAKAGNLTQSASSFASVMSFAFLYDKTNGSSLPASKSFTSSVATISGPLNAHYVANVSFVIRATLATGHTYFVITLVEASQASLVSVGGTGTASGRISLSGPQDHARLRAITIV